MSAPRPAPGADPLGLTLLILGGAVSFLHVLANFLSLKQPHGYPSAETMHIFKPMSSRAIGAMVEGRQNMIEVKMVKQPER